MKSDFKMVVLIVEWSSFRGGLKARFYGTTDEPPLNIQQLRLESGVVLKRGFTVLLMSLHLTFSN